MRKYFLTLVFLSIIAFFATNNVFADDIGTVKIGLDMQGEHVVSIQGVSATENVDTGLSLTLEYGNQINENMLIGCGITSQLPRAQERFAGDFSFLPIYGLVKVGAGSSDISPYFIGQLGYNFFMGDDLYKGTGVLEGGMYYGFGGGIIFQKGPQVELLYSVNNGSVEWIGYEYDIEYSKVTLSFGYNF